MHTFLTIRTASVLVLVGALVGCAAPKPLYSWNGYQTQVYSYLKSDGGDAVEQIQALEKGAQHAAGRGATLPPGYQAHLGLLYLNSGHADQAMAAWEQEKKQFPESSQYIDYLIGNMKKNGI